MSRSSRLLTCLGTGLAALAAVPAAHAATTDPQPGPPAPVPASAPAAPVCGGSAADFAGGYQDIEYREVGYLIDTDKGTITVYYRGEPIDQGPVRAGAGSIAWQLDGSTYVSLNITCGDAHSPSQVTAIQTIAPSNQERVTLSRAA